ncbi:hypothetical protein MUK42_34149 [Musa troglodytarum]|uniref:Uncharacterized protein n=1 Tax=Musa troglodytarum TaxID=320322 RepID=A0A9E7EE15_9LILI|nr:hypothetical protein MUK42_34149 [Musa troglodytarum]
MRLPAAVWRSAREPRRMRSRARASLALGGGRRAASVPANVVPPRRVKRERKKVFVSAILFTVIHTSGTVSLEVNLLLGSSATQSFEVFPLNGVHFDIESLPERRSTVPTTCGCSTTQAISQMPGSSGFSIPAWKVFPGLPASPQAAGSSSIPLMILHVSYHQEL